MTMHGNDLKRAPFRRRHRATRAVLFGLVLTLTGSAFYTSVLIIRRQEALHQVSRHNVSWTITQAAAEVARLQAAIGGHAITPTPKERQAILLRLDIVTSRIPLLESDDARVSRRS